MKSHRSLLTLAIALLLVACSTAQVETAKRVASQAQKVGSVTLPIIAKIATAYGAPYASVVEAFTEAVVPGYRAPVDCGGDDDDGGYADDEDYSDGGDYQDGDYSDGDYSDGDYSDGDYSQDDDYSDQDYSDGDYTDQDDYGDGEYKSIGSYGNECDEGYDDGDYAYDDGEGAYGEYDYDEGDYEEGDYDDSMYETAEAGVDKLIAQVDIVREVVTNGQSSSVPVRDGDTLNADDNYKVQVGCNTECYAYIAQLDATGRLDPILPSSLVTVSNPLPGNDMHSIPAGDSWFFLDNNKGVEQVYFILSQTPRDDIELIFQQLSRANASLQQQKAVSIDEPLVLAKGIGGVRPGRRETVELPDGSEGNYLATLLQSVEAEIVITRWFNHQ